jgi:hypothetical protein
LRDLTEVLSLVLCVMFFQIVVWHLVLFLLVIVLSVVLLFTAYDNPADIFILFFQFQWEISRTWGERSHIGCQNKIPKLSHMSWRFIFDLSIYMTCGYLDIQIDHFSIIFIVNYFIWIRHIGILFRYVTTELHKKLVDANHVCRAIYGLYRSEEIILSKIKSLENMLDN